MGWKCSRMLGRGACIVTALITVLATTAARGGGAGDEKASATGRGAVDRLFPQASELRRVGANVSSNRSGAFRVFAIPLPLTRKQGLLHHRMEYWKMDGGILKIGIASFATNGQAEEAAENLVASMQKQQRAGGKAEFPARRWWKGEQPEQIIFVERGALVKVQCFPRVHNNWQLTKRVARLVLQRIVPHEPEVAKETKPAVPETESREEPQEQVPTRHTEPPATGDVSQEPLETK